MRLVGGFLPVPMHLDPALDLTEATAAIATLAAGGSEVVVLAARSDDGSYDYKVLMSDEEWTVLLSNLDRLQQVVRDHGMTPTLHPHVGTAIEDRDAVLRLLDSSDILLCLDTGHLLIGGMQPLELLAAAADRVAHVHLKDVNETVAATVAAGDASYLGAVRQGLYTPLGDGDLDIAAIVTALEEIGYQGKYVLEQDCALDGEPEPGQGPLLDVRHSIDFLTSVAS
jgi:inosose dehydratase